MGSDFDLKELLHPAAMSPSDLQCNLPILLLLNLSLLLCRLRGPFQFLCNQGTLTVQEVLFLYTLLYSLLIQIFCLLFLLFSIEFTVKIFSNAEFRLMI